MIIANRSVDRGPRAGCRVPGFAIELDDIAYAPVRGRHRGRLDCEPDTDRDARDGRGRAARAPAPPDVHDPGHRGAARHRRRPSRNSKTCTSSAIDDLQSVVDRQPRGSPPGRARGGHTDRRRRSTRFEQDAAQPRCGDRRSASCATRRSVPASRRSNRRGACWRAASRHRKSLEFLATTLTNRLMHAPSRRLREAAESGDAGTVEAIAAIYRPDSGR